MKPQIEIPRSLRSLPPPWTVPMGLLEARKTLPPSEANVRTALDIAARALDASLHIPGIRPYDGFPAIYRDEFVAPNEAIDRSISTPDDLTMEIAERASSTLAPLTPPQLEIFVGNWIWYRNYWLAEETLKWVGEARANQPNAGEAPQLFDIYDRYIEKVVPLLATKLLGAIWDVARDESSGRLLDAATNEKLAKEVRDQASFLYNLQFDDPDELKRHILRGKPALPRDSGHSSSTDE